MPGPKIRQQRPHCSQGSSTGEGIVSFSILPGEGYGFWGEEGVVLGGARD